MISWRLWRALRTPFVAHAIYQQRGVWRQIHAPPHRLWKRIETFYTRHQERISIFVIACGILVTALFGPTPVLLLLFGFPLLVMFVGIPLMLVTAGTLYGAALAFIVSGSIAKEQAQGRFSLLGLTHYGIGGAAWALCNLEFHRSQPLVQVRSLFSGIFIILATFWGFPFLFSFLTFFAAPGDRAVQAQFNAFISLTIISSLPFLDFVQSTNTASIIGMLSPLVTRFTNARALAISGFLAVQFATYLLIAFLCLVLYPRLYYMQGWTLDMPYTFLCGVTFYLVREVIIVLLWVILAQHLDADLKELDEITGIGIRPVNLSAFFKNLLRQRAV